MERRRCRLGDLKSGDRFVFYGDEYIIINGQQPTEVVNLRTGVLSMFSPDESLLEQHDVVSYWVGGLKRKGGEAQCPDVNPAAFAKN